MLRTLATLLSLTCLAVLALTPASAQARWSRVAAVNVQESWELIRQAAWMAGIEDQAPVLAALLANESNLSAVRGGAGNAHWGPGQISWTAWGPLLKKRGVAEQAEDMMIDAYTGILATAVVLAHLRETYPERSLDIVLCAYGVGSLALSFERDCQYSREVMDNVNKVHRVVWARVGDEDGGRGQVAALEESGASR
jgi:hypothetical protein